MLQPKITFFLLIFFYIILCQEATKTKESQEKKESTVNPESIKELNSTNETLSHGKQRRKQDSVPFNISINEMDTIMLCTVVVQESVKKQHTDIEGVQKRLNLSSPNQVYDKVGTDIFEKCNREINITLVNKYFKNLTFVNEFKWEKEFDEYAKIDYDRYANVSDLLYTMSQQVLMYKFHKVEEIYRQKRADEREKIQNENKKIRIGKIDMESIPSSIKLGVFLVILILFFGGIFYFLKTLDRKPKDKKKKEKKKKYNRNMRIKIIKYIFLIFS